MSGGGWPFGSASAASLVAATAWPYEQAEAREEWAQRLVTEPDLLAQEAKRARARLESAIKWLEASDD